MSFPPPIPGVVIRYSYLWDREHQAGLEEGNKDRPCAVVLAIIGDGGRTNIYVLPVTHSAPTSPDDAIEIPRVVKSYLGLDAGRSWIVITEANIFAWPGPDLRPAINGDPSTIVYGYLPPNFFDHVRRKFIERARRGKAKAIKRTE